MQPFPRTQSRALPIPGAFQQAAGCKKANAVLFVVHLRAMKHDGRKRDVAAESYAVLVADLFCRLEVDVLVDRNGVAAGLAHDFDVSRGIAAHEE